MLKNEKKNKTIKSSNELGKNSKTISENGGNAQYLKNEIMVIMAIITSSHFKWQKNVQTKMYLISP